MVNVALPAIAQTLDVAAAQVVWVVNAYGLTVAMALLPLSSLADRVGFKRLFRIGLATFLLGAICSSLSPTIETLIASRIIQGLGAACIMCLFGGLMRHVYPVKLLARGIAINAMNVAVTSVAGPTISSVILVFANWRWMFISVAPLVILTFFFMRHLPDVPTVRVRFDGRAAVSSALAISLFILGLDQLAKNLTYAALYLAAGTALAIWVIRYSSVQTRPLVPLDLLRIGAIRSALAASVSSFAAQMAIFVALPFYLLSTYGHDPLTVGLLMACWPLGAAVMAAVASRLVERFEVAVLCAIGAFAMGLGALLIVLLPADVAMQWLILAMVLGGLGFGFFQTPNNRALLGAAPRERAGAIGGLQAVTRVFGQTVGAALVATAFALSAPHGASLGLLVGTAFASIAFVVNVRRFYRR